MTEPNPDKKVIKRFIYIKPTRFKHDSGYRCFEVGYCSVDDKNNAVNIEVLGNSTDHIWSYKCLLREAIPEASTWSMDLLNNGYIRIFSFYGELKWTTPYGLSSMNWELIPSDKPDEANNSLLAVSGNGEYMVSEDNTIQGQALAQTYGEKAVGLTFNPSSNPTVITLKKNLVDFIDQCNSNRASATDPEVKRMYSVAITEAQTAQMWAVKASTWSN